MQDCIPDEWVKMLRKYFASDLEIFIPGHGPVGTKDDLILMKDYINLLRMWIVESEKLEKGIEDILQMQLPGPYNTWTVGSSRHELNYQYLINTKLEFGI